MQAKEPTWLEKYTSAIDAAAQYKASGKRAPEARVCKLHAECLVRTGAGETIVFFKKIASPPGANRQRYEGEIFVIPPDISARQVCEIVANAVDAHTQKLLAAAQRTQGGNARK